MRKFLAIAAVVCYLLYKFLCWGSDIAQRAGAADIERNESDVAAIIE